MTPELQVCEVTSVPNVKSHQTSTTHKGQHYHKTIAWEKFQEAAEILWAQHVKY